ncbi:unnamed protein product [Heligmosomoides polygyrus]|uniref:Endo/exonuclease/phosphatase domain-containing protein n=1 Tax=Heligmosomoides polygyrus TaxID=6339 RepID=A0A183G9U3_HELPZ|nr:unnamed protein product [Heligmosomoides polygyrus]
MVGPGMLAMSVPPRGATGNCSRNLSKTRVATLNETRWSCRKSRDIGRDFKAVLCGNRNTNSGVGIIASERFRDSIERLYHFFSAYAPQTGCSDQAKDEFWNLLDEKTAEVPSRDAIIITGDLNGHVGAAKDGYSCHGGFVYGSRNPDGSAIASDGSLMVEVNSRVRAVWSKWRSLTGVLCDKKMPDRLKSKIYSTVVRQLAMYGAECWPATKETKSRLSVMKTKMLRWMAGVTRLDRIRNEAIRQKFGVAPIADKMREANLRWYGHILRGNEDSVRKIGLYL